MPPTALVDDIVSRIESSQPAPRKRGSFRRFGLAGIAAVAMLTVFAAFGGAGFAASGVSGVASSTADAITTLVKPEQEPARVATPNSTNRVSPDRGGGGCNADDGGGDDVSAARGQYCKPRKTICHVKNNGKQKTLTLPVRAADRHLDNHPSDYDGPCTDDDGDGDD